MPNTGPWAATTFYTVDLLNAAFLQSGTDASKPAASQTGRIWYSSDIYKLYRDNGSSWDLVDLSASFATPILAADGSATAPAYSFAADTNTGVYRVGADTLGVALGGALKLQYSAGAFAFQESVSITSTGTLTLGAVTLGGAVTGGSQAISGIASVNGLIITADTGVVTTGTWNAGVVGPAYGGTGVANNAASTLTISGNYATTLTVTGITGVTLPTTGTLATLAGTEELDNKTLDSSVGKGTWTASGTWTLPAFTLAGTLATGSNAITSGSTSGDWSIYGGTSAGGAGGRIRLLGGLPSNPDQILLYTANAAQNADVLRLDVTGNATTAVALWTAITHTGLKVTSGASIAGAGAWSITTDSGNLTLTPAGQTTTSKLVEIKNNADASFDALYLDSGSTSAQNAILRFRDRGSNIWAIYKDAGAVGSATLRVHSTSLNTDVLAIKDSDGRVAIGQNFTTPDSLLHVHNATAGVVTANATAIVTIENNTHASLQFLTPNTSESAIYFGDVDSATVGRFIYRHTTNDFYVDINGLNQLIWTSGAFAFQRSTTISSTGTITIDGTGVLTIADSTEFSSWIAGPSSSGIFRLFGDSGASVSLTIDDSGGVALFDGSGSAVAANTLEMRAAGSNIVDISGAAADFILRAKRTAANAGTAITVQTYNALDASTTRLTVTSGVATAVATWSDITHTGLKVTSGGSIAGAGAWSITTDSGDLLLEPAGHVTPNTSAAKDLGSSSKKWKDGYFSGVVNVGDIAMANGVRFTEHGDDMDIITPAGMVMARVDQEGNLYIRGEVRKLVEV